ncbi:DUF4282 domain-containing protein [Pelagibacterium lacus]|uniref:DUF4282 domain-containing protein n=1 Tax=Pelagibacterium lacus TaxID=2282655 RepID=A0A369W532_9HYPH|nr:DUF4282 domain-containing protein [Pelagibacterium lacus]RDE09784.1 DUF4282 domain-containing protein [Pelagibacterium lacus]
MKMDDLRKLATGNVVFNLNRIIAPKLVRILYLLGLAAILLWAVAHFFGTFRFGFGSGLWGLLEIAVYGLLALVVLRIVCEAVLVYFGTHATDPEEYTPPASRGSLFDDVRDAIEDLAETEDDDRPVTPPAPPPSTPASRPAQPVAEEPAVMPRADTPTPTEKPEP